MNDRYYIEPQGNGLYLVKDRGQSGMIIAGPMNYEAAIAERNRRNAK